MVIYCDFFVQNKYFIWYSSIIESAKTRDTKYGYTELHHIIPKSLGGSNKKENLVRLTYREHFLCHWLLTKFINNSCYTKKMLHALAFMIGDNKLGSKTFTSWQYEIAKRAAKDSMTGENNHFCGKTHTLNAREKMRKGQKRRDEMFGRPSHTEESREKLRKARTGKKQTDAHRESMKIFHENNKLIWYNNGEKSVMIIEGHEIPDGFIKGRGKSTSKNLVWYNNGTVSKRLRPDQEIPDGFIKGPLIKPDCQWLKYNNGVVNTTIQVGAPIPEGFVRGVLKSNKKMGSWYNNGVTSKRFNVDQEIPKDFVKGRGNESKLKKSQWYTDGVKPIRITDGDSIPEGYNKGLGSYKKKGKGGV